MRGILIGQDYQEQSKAASREICRNLYPHTIPQPPGSRAKSNFVFYACPGLATKYTIGSGPLRSLYYSNGRCFAVSGTELYELFSDLTYLLRGVIANDGTPVSIVSNRFQLCLVSVGSTYIYDLATDVLTNIGLSLSQVAFADGYFVGLTPASQMIRISGQYDGITWDPLDFASSEGDPDNIVGIIADHKEIWTFGEQSIEVWADSGNPDFPFERIPGALIEQGCAAAAGVLKADNALFWIGSDTRGARIVWRAQGYTPLRVSNHALEYQLSTYSTVADAIAYAYQDQGHMFCVWTFPTADKTWCYDCATGLWHERASWDQATAQWHRHPGQAHCFAFGMHLIGDKDSGKVYDQSINYFDFAGSPRRWVRSIPLGSAENKYLFPANFELDLEVGAGIDPTLPGIDPGNPQVILRYSKDGGYTYGPEKWRGAGHVGEYLYRCRWPGNLGRARKPFIELSATDALRICLIDGYADLDGGIS